LPDAHRDHNIAVKVEPRKCSADSGHQPRAAKTANRQAARISHTASYGRSSFFLFGLVGSRSRGPFSTAASRRDTGNRKGSFLRSAHDPGKTRLRCATQGGAAPVVASRSLRPLRHRDQHVSRQSFQHHETKARFVHPPHPLLVSIRQETGIPHQQSVTS